VDVAYFNPFHTINKILLFLVRTSLAFYIISYNNSFAKDICGISSSEITNIKIYKKLNLFFKLRTERIKVLSQNLPEDT